MAYHDGKRAALLELSKLKLRAWRCRRRYECTLRTILCAGSYLLMLNPSLLMLKAMADMLQLRVIFRWSCFVTVALLIPGDRTVLLMLAILHVAAYLHTF